MGRKNGIKILVPSRLKWQGTCAKNGCASVETGFFPTGARKAGSMMIREGGIWNLKEVLRQNPVPPEEAEGGSFSESLKRTVVAQGSHFSVLLVQAQPQTAPYPHVHDDHDEMIYILEGEGEFIVGDVTKRVKPGDIIYAPAGTVHAPNFPVKGVRLVVYAPCFDPDNPDRREVTQPEQPSFIQSIK